MKFTFAATVLLLLIPVSVYTQTPADQLKPCALKPAQSPAVRGIKLEMKLQDVLALFPGSREDQYVKSNISTDGPYSKYGVVNFAVTPGQYSTRQQFMGIEALHFTFVDEQLVDYYVQYSGPSWPKLDDFLDKVVAAFHLPPAQTWASDNSSRKTLTCNGFRIQASTSDGRGSLSLKMGDDPSQIQRARRAAAEAQARRDFRP